MAGYRLWYGTAPRIYSSVLNVGNVTAAAVPNIQPGTTYYIALTAYDADGFESAHSAEVPYVMPTPTPSPSPTPPASPPPSPTVSPTPSPTPSPSPNFTIVVSPTLIQTPAAGGYITCTVTITPSNGFHAPIILVCDGLPPTVARGSVLNPAGSTSVTMRFFVFGCLPSGSYPFTVTTQSCSPTLTRSASVTLVKQ